MAAPTSFAPFSMAAPVFFTPLTMASPIEAGFWPESSARLAGAVASKAAIMAAIIAAFDLARNMRPSQKPAQNTDGCRARPLLRYFRHHEMEQLQLGSARGLD